MGEEAPAFFGGDIPRHYDEGLGPHIFIDYGEALAERVADENPETVLELAAGTGLVTRALRNLLPTDCKLVATDLSKEMLDVAAEKFSPGDEVEFDEADAMNLRFEDGAFDVIACQFGVMFFPDKAESFREAKRVLKPGGVYHFNVWDSWTGNPFARVVQGAVETLFPNDPPQFYKLPFSYPDPEVIEADLKSAGFEDIVIETVSLQVEIDYELFVRGIVYGNPLMDEVEERGGDVAALTEALEDKLRAKFGEPGVMPLRALFVRAA